MLNNKTNISNNNKRSKNNSSNSSNNANAYNKNNKSNIDLSILKMEKGQKYETIITTSHISTNGDIEINSAPIGVIFSEKDKILCKIFKGSYTLKNIIENKRFIINITEDPILFTLSTLKELISGEYEEIENSMSNIKNIGLKKADAYLIATVSDIKYGFDKTANKKSTNNLQNSLSNHKSNNNEIPYNSTNKNIKTKNTTLNNENYNAGIIKAKIDKIIIKKEGARGFNRANSYVIESLVNYSRFDIVDDIKKEEYINRFKEAKRVINRVGGKEHKIAINKIEEKIYKK